MSSDSNIIINITAKVAFSGLICAVGLIGNLLVMFVIIVLREFKKSVTHWYVLQLAIADSLFLLTLPFKMVEDLQGNWIYPEWMCKAKETLLFLNYYASILFLMIMSVDRYIAVCHPFSTSLQKFRKPTTATIITVITWIVGLLICIPVMMYSFKIGIKGACTCRYQFPKPPVNHTALCLSEGFDLASLQSCLDLNNPPKSAEEPHCVAPPLLTGTTDTTGQNASFLANDTGSGADYYDYYGSGNDSIILPVATTSLPEACHYFNRAYGWKAFNVFNFIAMFCIPLLVMSACYGFIIYRLSSKKMSNTSDNRSGKKSVSKSESDRRRITVMCMCLVVCFIVCWLPFHVAHLSKVIGLKAANVSVCTILPIVASLLAYSNSALNPYLYSFVGSKFYKRWSRATSVVRKSVGASIPATGHGSVHFMKKRKSKDNGSSQGSAGTVFTRMNRKSAAASTMDASNINTSQSSDKHTSIVK